MIVVPLQIMLWRYGMNIIETLQQVDSYRRLMLCGVNKGEDECNIVATIDHRKLLLLHSLVVQQVLY